MKESNNSKIHISNKFILPYKVLCADECILQFQAQLLQALRSEIRNWSVRKEKSSLRYLCLSL